MDKSFAPIDLETKNQLKSLVKRSDAKGLGHLAGHLLLLAATTGLLAGLQGIWRLPAMVLQGLVLVALFAPAHECIHRTAFKSHRLNDAVAWLSGLVLLLPPNYFRAFHFAHHRHTQDPKRDPELAGSKPNTHWAYFKHVSGIPYWWERATTTLKLALGRVELAFAIRREVPALVWESRVFLSFYLALGLGSAALETHILLVYWILPVMLGQPLLRLYLLAEHTGCPEVPDMLQNSRTTKTNSVVRFLAWNMPYHSEHHCYPALPFHALPAAHEILKSRIEVQADGYWRNQKAIYGALKS